jgi:hypothetical protein
MGHEKKQQKNGLGPKWKPFIQMELRNLQNATLNAVIFMTGLRKY